MVSVLVAICSIPDIWFSTQFFCLVHLLKDLLDQTRVDINCEVRVAPRKLWQSLLLLVKPC